MKLVGQYGTMWSPEIPTCNRSEFLQQNLSFQRETLKVKTFLYFQPSISRIKRNAIMTDEPSLTLYRPSDRSSSDAANTVRGNHLWSFHSLCGRNVGRMDLWIFRNHHHLLSA